MKKRKLGLTVLELDARELATVLAALRYWQTRRVPRGMDLLNDISTNADEFSALAMYEIDTLCARLNRNSII